MLDELNKQIGLYKKNGKSKFVFVEIGNYLGESLELFGEQIHNSLKDNYLIVSIDPYIPYTSQEEEKQNKSQVVMMNKSIKKIYYYFLNNISNTILVLPVSLSLITLTSKCLPKSIIQGL